MKTTLLKKMACAAVVLLFGASASAQNGWNARHVKNLAGDAPVAIAPKAIGDDILFLGYSHGYASTIYAGDGYSFASDARVGVGALMTKELLSPYAGGKIVGMRLGWNGYDFATSKKVLGECDAFISKGINGEEIFTKHAELDVLWNVIELDAPMEIAEDPEDLFVGMYASIPANLICIPTLSQASFAAHSCYLWSEGDENEDGSKNWYDASADSRPLAIQLIVEDPDGRFAAVGSISSVIVEEISVTEENATGLMRISNGGTEDIKSLEVTTQFGDQSKSLSFNFSRPVPFDEESSLTVPVYCFGTGEHSVSVTKINGVENRNKQIFKVPLVGVPADVSEKYTLRPLLEWFVSENSYMTATYTDEHLMPVYKKYADRMTLVSQHLDDQFMTGEDDATALLLDYANNDSSSVAVPCCMFNRAKYVSGYLVYGVADNTTAYHVFTSFSAPSVYDYLLTCPTFASVNVSSALEGEKVKISVDGDIAENILPEGEKLNLTVYLMENDVFSDSQIFWGEKEEEAHEGEYTHPNVIRELVTPFYGQQLPNASGAYEATFEVDLDPSYDKSKLKVVAFLNRSLENGNFHAQVINSAEAAVGSSTGISSVENGAPVSIESRNGRFQSDRGTLEVYTFDGRRVANNNLNAGVYLVKVVSDGRTTVRKMIVK